MSYNSGRFLGGLLRETFRKENKNDPNVYEAKWVCERPKKRANLILTWVSILLMGISFIIFLVGVSQFQQSEESESFFGLIGLIIFLGVFFLIGLILFFVSIGINNKCNKAVAKSDEKND